MVPRRNSQAECAANTPCVELGWPAITGCGFDRSGAKLACCVITSKCKRTLKAFAIVALGGGVLWLAASPFHPFGEGVTALDAAPPAYSDSESERTALAAAASDSMIDDRIGRPVEEVVKVGSGDTLIDLLLRAGVEAPEANQAIEALRDVYNPRSLKAGQKVLVTFERPAHGLGVGDFSQITLDADPIREVSARRSPNRGFVAGESKRPVSRQVAHFVGSIKSSLFESAAAAGVPAPVIIGMIRALSYDVDFQRDIQSGDGFEVMFEGWYDTRGKLVRNGEMLFAAVTLSGSPIAMYRYEDSVGTVEFFNAKGESVKKALLKTPVDGAKITSGFGMRNHPILGFSKMHKGIDFGVPAGTPIMAAGDGLVEVAGPSGAYGNYVRIRHSSGYATAYAHMSRFAQGIHSGKRVAQGQVVGFVGSTGRSTGPHLHYEILMGGTQINPMSVKMPTGVKLAGRELERFHASRRASDSMMAKIPPATRIAATGSKPGALTN
ncbi:MAG: peptidoglycan DD-metalloendopeptidase family protein [Magnetospirillum sp.]|nr:peptidoglycan DD-metalloendopeptidase family protein [Magnetospirillum sp.]